MTTQNAVATRDEKMHIVATMDTVAGFEALQREAALFVKSDIVPKQFQQLPNAVIAIDMAHRMGASPLMVMQNLYVVHGIPAWSAKFMIATFNHCRRFAPVRYEFSGKEGTDEYGCRAVTKDLTDGERIEGTRITIGMAKAEGWYKQNPKWTNIPEQMLRYRAASWMIRATAPEISMGLQTVEEVEDVPEMWVDAKPVEDVFSAGRHKLPTKREKSQEEPAPMDPNAEPKRKDSAVPDKEFSSAFGKLSINYEEHSDTINAALRAKKIGVEFFLDITPDCKDEKVIRAVVEIAKGF